MNTTQTFEHENKKYKIYSNVQVGALDYHTFARVEVQIIEPEKQNANVVKEIDGNVVHFRKSSLQNGDITGLRMTDEAIEFVKKLQEEAQKELEKKKQEEKEEQVFTYRTWTGEKRVKADSIEEAAEYFSEEYDVNATPENVEKVEEDSGESENTEEVEEPEEPDEEKEETDEKVCSAKGCGKRKDKEDTYCQFHQELKTEAQNTDRDTTPAHPTGGMY